jgi:phage terminase large subunit
MPNDRILIHDYRPRAQFAPFHARDKRWACIVAHRRSGKTVAAINELIARALHFKRGLSRPHFGFVSPYREQSKIVAWSYLKHYTRDFVTEAREADLSVDLLNGSQIRLFGSDNADALRGNYFDGVVLDEFADQRPSVWGEVIRPLLADRGGWAVFCGTPRGRNHLFEIYSHAKEHPESWFTLLLRARDSGILSAAELTDARATMDSAQYEQEFNCSFEHPRVGSYYGALLTHLEETGKLVAFEVQPTGIYTAWDLGHGDHTSVWFYRIGRDGVLEVVDYYENHTQPLSHYFAELDARGYAYARHFLPHDARAHTLQTGLSISEHFAARKEPFAILPQLDLADGIQAVRATLEAPIRIHGPRCRQGLAALAEYHREYSEDLRAFRDRPAHSWGRDGADAFRYLAMSLQRIRSSLAPEEEPKPPRVRKPGDYTLNELWETRR